ncbi:MAG TPA: hypothetical protein VNO30_24885 [Kofleriaceae bacterium]|nr:hypothetical protein [Kofleriaceae bacterium]
MLGAVAFALIQITAKRLRNAVLVRRGAAPYRDVILVLGPFLVLFAILGAVAGAVAAALAGAWWPASALAAGAVPALLTVVVVIGAALQARGAPLE